MRLIHETGSQAVIPKQRAVRSFRMVVKRDAHDVHVLRGVIMSALQAVPLSEEKCFAFELALGEGLANAVKHGYGSTIRVSCKIGEGCAFVEIVNNGKAFIPDPQLPDADAQHGRGIGLMVLGTDHMELRTHGNTVVLRLAVKTGV